RAPRGGREGPGPGRGANQLGRHPGCVHADQQYVKQLNLYSAKTAADQQAAVPQDAGPKLREARRALELGEKYRQKQILHSHPNIATCGGGACGGKTAAKTSSPHTPGSRLSAGQAALLAGLVQSPTRYNTSLPPQGGKPRRHEVLDALVRDG